MKKEHTHTIIVGGRGLGGPSIGPRFSSSRSAAGGAAAAAAAALDVGL